MTDVVESLAKYLFQTAIAEGRCADLLDCLWAGGSATVDHSTGKLVFVTSEQLAELAGS